MNDHIFVTPMDALSHFGTKGMKWGVRNDTASSMPSLSAKGIVARADGSITVSKGANLQRLVRSSGESLPMKDLTYASLNNYDNARYVKIIGGKGILGGGRDQILSMTATKSIKAPSVDAATKITSNLMMKDSKFRESVMASSFTGSMTPKEWKQIQADPVGKTAKAWYHQANTALTFDEKFVPGISYAQKTLRDEMLSKGFNALRDENDFSSGVSKAPIIIFNPKSSLKVTKVTDITDELRKANKQQLRQYKNAGKDWIDKELYKT